jgi:hypothetical protein
MAEARDINVKVDLRFDTSYPKVPSTIEERTQALKDAKGLLTSTSSGGVITALTGVSQGAVQQNGDGTMSLLRIAEYIVVGHDYLDTHPIDVQKGPSKKERRQRIKEIRKIVTEEVEEEFDRRQREGAGTLIIPETLVERADGTQTPIADYYREKQKENKPTWPDGILEEDGSVTDTRPEDSDGLDS